MKKTNLLGFGAISAMTAVLSLGCDPTIDRGQSKQPPIPPAGEPTQNTFDTVPEGGSKSSLGKSRDAAVRVREKMEARDAEIGKMADDVFKTTPSTTPTTPSKP